MSQMPTNAELTTALTEAGIPVPGSSRLTAALALAVEAWQDATGWYPFAAASGATADQVTLSWPNDAAVVIVPFGGGIVSSATAPVVELDESALTAGADYTLFPPDAPRRGVPYTYLKMRNRRLTAQSVLTLSGVWGYCAYDAVPEVAKQAVLAKAALNIAAPEIQTGDATRQQSQIEQGTVKIQYGTSAEERLAAVHAWESDWATGLSSYRRQGVM